MSNKEDALINFINHVKATGEGAYIANAREAYQLGSMLHEDDAIDCVWLTDSAEDGCVVINAEASHSTDIQSVPGCQQAILDCRKNGYAQVRVNAKTADWLGGVLDDNIALTRTRPQPDGSFVIHMETIINVEASASHG